MGNPLGIDVIALVHRVDVAPPEQATAQRPGPCVPLDPEAIDRGAKARVLDEVGALEHEVAQRRLPAYARSPHGGRHGAQGRPLGGGDGGAVHDRALDPGSPAFSRQRAGADHPRRRGPGELRHALDVDPAFVPEPAAHRQIGARLERLGADAREQGECRDHARLFPGGKAGELVEVAQVARSPAAGRVQREQRREDPKGAPVLAEAPPGAGGRRDDERRRADPAPDEDHEAVIAARQETGQRHRSPVDVATVQSFARQRPELIALHAPVDALTVFGFDRTFQISVRLAEGNGDRADGRVVEDRHRFHDPFYSRAAAAAQQPGRIAGPADRHTEPVQYRQQHLRIRVPLHAGGVHILEHDARIGREAPQRGRDLRVRRHRCQSDHVIRPGTYGSASAGWQGRARAARKASRPASWGTWAR